MKRFAIILLCIIFSGITLLPVNAQSGDDLNKGLAALKRKEYQQAETIFSGMIKEAPDNMKVRILRGTSRFYQGEYTRALEDFYEVEQHKPGLASLWIARTYTQENEKEKAMRALEEHLKSVYRRPETEIRLDTLLQPLENTPAWRSLWKKDWYSQREKTVAGIRYDISQGILPPALKEINEQLSQYNDDATLWALRARIYLQAGDEKKAGQDIKKALSLRPDDTVALYTAARLAVKTGKYEEEAGYMQKLYRAEPGRFLLLLKSADAWAAAGRYDEAIKPLQKYMEYFPGDVEARFRAGEIAGKTGHYREALKYLSEVVEKDPSQPLHFVARGDMYVKVHTYRYAVDDYAMALDLDPTNGDIYYSRAQAYLKMGDTKNACFDLRQALHYGKKEAIPLLQKYCGY